MRPVARSRWTGAVLCGGASTRMGRDKALLELDGVPLARRVADALGAAGAGRVLAVGGDAAALRGLGFDVVPDDHPGEGPLGGILTALRHSRDDLVVVLACDLPGATAGAVGAVVGALVASPGAAVAWPVVDGHDQVLHAAWRAPLAAAPLAEAFAAGVRSPRRAAAALPTVAVSGLTAGATRGVNRPEDLASLSARAAGSTGTGHNGDMSDRTPIPEVDVAGLVAAHATGADVLDVRQPDEYEAGHVPGAVLVPLDQLADRLDEVPRGEPLYVICKSGGRSAAAVEVLTAAGYDATNVAGGTMAWIEAGHPTVSGPDAGER